MKPRSVIQAMCGCLTTSDPDGKKTFDKYLPVVRELADGGGKMVLTALDELKDNFSPEVFIDKLDGEIDPVTTAELLYSLEYYHLPELVEQAQKRKTAIDKKKLEARIKSSVITLDDAVLEYEELKIEPVRTIKIPTAQDIMQNAGETIPWIIKDLIPAGGLMVMAGMPKSGKSMFALDMALSLSSDKQVWMEQNLIRSKVVYIDAENAEVLIKQRLRMFGLGKHTDLYFITRQTLGIGSIDLTNPKTFALVKSMLASLDLQSTDLIVIDSFRRVFSGNENDSQEVAKAMAAITDLSPAAKLVLHHLRKQTKDNISIAERTRGSGDIMAAVDGLITIETQGNLIKVSTIGLSLARWTSGIKPIEIIWLPTLTTLKFRKLDAKTRHLFSEQCREAVLSLIRRNQSITFQELATMAEFGTDYLNDALKFLLDIKQVKRTYINGQTTYSLL